MRDLSAQLVPLDVLSPEDAQQFVEWARSQQQETMLDPAVIGYPRTCMALVNDSQGATVAAMPVQPVLMLESFLREPSLSKGQLAIAFLRLHALVVETMKSTGMHETYFLTKRADLALLAAKHGGWTECLHDPLRGTWLMKLKLDAQCS